jgi:hypothetical protein
MTVNKTHLIDYAQSDSGMVLSVVVDSPSYAIDDVKSALYATMSIDMNNPALVISTDGETWTLSAVDSACFYGSVNLIIRPYAWVGELTIPDIIRLQKTTAADGRMQVEQFPSRRGTLARHEYERLKKIPHGSVVDSPGSSFKMQMFIGDIVNKASSAPWIFSSKSTPYNLGGCTFVYFGPNVGQHYNGRSTDSHVLKIELGERCSNLRGTMTLGYNVAPSPHPIHKPSVVYS